MCACMCVRISPVLAGGEKLSVGRAWKKNRQEVSSYFVFAVNRNFCNEGDS